MKLDNWKIIGETDAITFKSSGKYLRKRWLIECLNCGHQIKVTQGYLSRKSTQHAGCKHCWLLPRGRAGELAVYRDYKSKCIRKKLPFNLSFDEVCAITSSACHYCGQQPSNIRAPSKYYKKGTTQPSSWGHYLYNGIDRIDNKQGYTITNCVSCCAVCNRAKSDMPYVVFIDWIAKICKKHKDKV